MTLLDSSPKMKLPNDSKITQETFDGYTGEFIFNLLLQRKKPSINI